MNPDKVDNKEAPPKYNDVLSLYVPEIYLGKPTESSSTNPTLLPHVEGVLGSEALLEILMCNDEYVIHPVDRLALRSRPVFTHIRDASNRVLFSSFARSGETGVDGPSGIVTNLLDTTGNSLMTFRRCGTACTVHAGDRIIGVIHGSSRYSSTLLVKNCLGNVVMTASRKNSSSYSFLANGVEVGVLERNGSLNTLQLTMAQGLDVLTKALLLSCAYLVYVMFFADTPSGRGLDAAQRRDCVCVMIMPFLLFVVIILLLGLLLYLLPELQGAS